MGGSNTPGWEVVTGNNVAGSGIAPHTSKPPVLFIPDATTAAACETACAGSKQCTSFAFAHCARGGEVCRYADECFHRTDAFWAPLDRPTSKCVWTSGRRVPPGNRTRSSAKNVVYVMVDDLRNELSCYESKAVRTPNVDRLAEEGVLFQHAYVQIAVCSPSRTSFLTGLRPHQSNVLNFGTDFRRATTAGDTILTLPAFFKRAGALATGMGKTYHPNLPPHYDEPASWSSEFAYFTAPKGSSSCGNDTSPWCSERTSVPEDQYADGLIVGEALRQLDAIVAKYFVPPQSPAPDGSLPSPYANPLSRPFFMAVGLHRPHMDWVVPPSFLARQPPAPEIPLASHPRFPATAPDWAFYNCTELTARSRLRSAHAAIQPNTPLSTAIAGNIRRNYYAAVEYMDAQVGRLLDALDKLGLTNSTALVFHGDHGWQLGELGQWCKESVFENNARTPLLLRAPWIAGSAGRMVSQVVELIDVYPTLAELSGLSSSHDNPLPSTLEGKSLVPLLHGESPNASASAFSLYPRWQRFDNHSHCFRPYSEIQAIGLSVRTAHWRFTDWVAWNASSGAPALTHILASELYNHSADRGLSGSLEDFETANLARDPALAEQVDQLRALVRRNFGRWPERKNT